MQCNIARNVNNIKTLYDFIYIIKKQNTKNYN